MPDVFDVIVLGTGAGSSAPAAKCRAAGLSVAIVDDQPFGGTCALRGCDPKMVLVGKADVTAWHDRMLGNGLSGTAALDWPALMRFKRTFTDPVPQATEKRSAPRVSRYCMARRASSRRTGSWSGRGSCVACRFA